VSKALQEFDLALRGKKKREKFLKEGKKRKELTVTRHAVINQSLPDVRWAWGCISAAMFLTLHVTHTPPH